MSVCQVESLSQVLRRLKAKKERSQQHELIGMVMRVLSVVYVGNKFTVCY